MTGEWDEKCHYTKDILFNGCMVNVLFIEILFYIEWKWLLMRNLATILHLKSQLCGKFQCFKGTDGNIEMLKNSWIPKNIN